MRGWKAWIGIAVAAVLLWWVFRNEDPAAIWQQIRGANFVLLGLAVAVTTAGFAVRAERWRFFLAPAQPASPFGARFAAVCIGFMANNLLPSGRVGEFARAYAYSRLTPVSASTAFATLVVERFSDGVALLLLLFLVIANPSFPADALPPQVATGVWLVSGSLTVVLAVSLGLLAWPERSLGVLGKLAAIVLPWPWARAAQRALEGFAGGLAAFRSWRLAVPAFAWSLGFWTLQSFSFWLGFWAFGIELPFAAALFLNTVVAFATALPAAPGYFGTFHAAATLALVGVYGAAEAPALGFAVGWHLGSFFPVTLLGLWYVRRVGVSFREIRGAREA